MRSVRMLLLLALLLLFFTALSPAESQDEVSWLLNQINCLRQSVGSPPLTMNVALSVAANRQAVNLANDALTNFHEGLDGSTPVSRAQDAGFTGSVGENVASGRQVSDPFNWWINSPIHYENMTNAHWKEIGIGIASGPHGTWYTLVFGAMNWQVNEFVPAPCGEFEPPPAPAVLENTSITSASIILGETQEETPDPDSVESIEPLPTPVILGLDEHGYIEHEIQSGETPGTIMLSYGYTWDALPTLMAINNMTEADARNLAVGDIFLVPPLDGTFTPVPDQAIEEATADLDVVDEEGLIISVITDTPSASSERVLPSSTPIATSTATTSASPTLTAFIAVLNTETLVSPAAFFTQVPTLSATNTSVPPVAFAVSLTPTFPPYTIVPPINVMPSATAAPPVTVLPEASDDRTSTLLTIAIVGQVVVIGVAAMVGYRWGRRRK